MNCYWLQHWPLDYSGTFCKSSERYPCLRWWMDLCHLWYYKECSLANYTLHIVIQEVAVYGVMWPDIRCVVVVENVWNRCLGSTACVVWRDLLLPGTMPSSKHYFTQASITLWMSPSVLNLRFCLDMNRDIRLPSYLSLDMLTHADVTKAICISLKTLIIDNRVQDSAMCAAFINLNAFDWVNKYYFWFQEVSLPITMVILPQYTATSSW